MTKKVVDKRYAKSGEYKNVLETIESRGKCPFCPEHFKYHKNPVLKKTVNWMITENSWPYKGARHHFIILGKKHKEGFANISDKDFSEIGSLVRWAIKEFKIPGGGLTMRFGDTTYTGATVVHLHAHLIVPELGADGKATPVYFPIG